MNELKKILLVEDNPYIMNINARLLSMNGYEVLQATTATEARELLKRSPADLAVLDIMLPDGNGVDLCRELKFLYSIPVIFVTAMSAISDITACLQAGDDYMTKPYDLDDLLVRIERLLPPETKETTITIEGAEIKITLKYDRMSRKFIERYPDLLKYPVYTPSGKRIMLSIEDARSYADLKPGIYKDCGSCRHYQQKKGTLLGVCSHEKMRSGSIKQMNTSASKEETV